MGVGLRKRPTFYFCQGNRPTTMTHGSPKTQQAKYDETKSPKTSQAHYDYKFPIDESNGSEPRLTNLLLKVNAPEHYPIGFSSTPCHSHSTKCDKTPRIFEPAKPNLSSLPVPLHPKSGISSFIFVHSVSFHIQNAPFRLRSTSKSSFFNDLGLCIFSSYGATSWRDHRLHKTLGN